MSKLDELKNQIISSKDIDENEKKEIISRLENLKNNKLNIMITGATGSGKSSTINALFNMEVAKVGISPDPETMEIKKYELDNLIIWDTPGLGDGKEKDRQHAKAIIKLLNEVDKNGKPLIDLVLVILDGGSRDLGTSYELINQIIIPNLGEKAKDRILIAINQADVAMKGRYWDYENNQPEPKLIEFLDKKVESVKKRIREATGIDVEPIYYSAGFKDDDIEQRPWNMTKLLYYIIKHTPKEKRLIYVNNLSTDKNVWKDDDKLKDYKKEIEKSFIETIVENAEKGAKIGEQIGGIFGEAGKTVGKVVGAAVGGMVGFFKGIFD